MNRGSSSPGRDEDRTGLPRQTVRLERFGRVGERDARVGRQELSGSRVAGLSLISSVIPRIRTGNSNMLDDWSVGLGRSAHLGLYESLHVLYLHGRVHFVLVHRLRGDDGQPHCSGGRGLLWGDSRCVWNHLAGNMMLMMCGG